jgi:hypothetical protein
MDNHLVAYTVSAYYINTNSYLPSQKTETIYDVNGTNPVATITTYTYNPFDFSRETTITASDNSTRKTELKYPTDFSTTSPYNTMITKNIIAPVVESALYKGATLLEKEVHTYGLQHNAFYVPLQLKQGIGANTPEIRATYQYDEKGNVREVIKDGIEKTVYLWGYNYQYPIAKIDNAVYSDVSQVLGTTLIQRVGSAAKPSDADLLTINNLRNNTTVLKEALVTTYTYKPLVGVEAITDPHGVKKTFYYYLSGRLTAVKDENGKTLEEYDYHFKN